jgi:small subunit ribosomal protein S8
MTSKQGYSDLITRIRNGYMAKLDSITFAHTSRNINLLRILRNEGLISGWSETISDPWLLSNNIKDLRISNFTKGRVLLKYVEGEPAVRTIETISKQSRRIFMSVVEMEFFLKKEGFNRLLILSTNKGLLTHAQAIHQRVGGEVVCAIK